MKHFKSTEMSIIMVFLLKSFTVSQMTIYPKKAHPQFSGGLEFKFK
ncbi:MAG: hypothetical protein ABI462_13030 [Ignavibacteria bacterium]